MKIRKIYLFHVAMPLIEPWVTAYGNQANIESLFVGLESDDLIGGENVRLLRCHFTIANIRLELFA